MSLSNLSSEGELYGFIDANNDVIDYNVLTNRPKINNKTVEGNHNGRYYELTESEVIDWIDYKNLPESTKKNGKIYYIRNAEEYNEKTISNVAVASFNDGSDNPLESLIIAITPDQEGSGTPSPSNPRTINGWTGAEIHVADGETPHIVDNTYNITWQTEAGTVYGGELDVKRGVLKVTQKTFNVDDSSKVTRLVNTLFRIDKAKYPDGDFQNDNIDGLMCEKFNPLASSINSDNCYNTINGLIIRPTSSYATAADFYNSVGNFKFTYLLATPIEYDLTPIQINSLLGENNIETDTGDIIELKYLSPTGERENQIRTNDEVFGRA